MSIQGKTALVFAANGAIGSAVAEPLAAGGARLHLSGRNAQALSALAERLGAESTQVDALDEDAVNAYVDAVAAANGVIDIVFNALGPRPAEGGYGERAVALPRDQFLMPMLRIVTSQFLTARAAARHMQRARQGTVIFLTASLSGKFVPYMSGITAACAAIEGMTRSLAAEWGPDGIRVNCVRAGGMPESRTIQETAAGMARTMGTESAVAARPTSDNVLGRPVRLAETAHLVAFLASDEASGIAGQVVNVCGGAIVS